MHLDNVASRLIASPKLTGAEALAGSQYRWRLLGRSSKREPFCERTWPLASETCVGDTTRGGRAPDDALTGGWRLQPPSLPLLRVAESPRLA